ncbi:D-alanyl-D-alanine carboxypeptidase, partial [Neisseria sp. P0014.S004]
VKPILETLQPVLAPIEKGQVLGKLKVMKDGKIIAEKDVVALTGVEEGSWLRRMWDAIVLWFKGLFS